MYIVRSNIGTAWSTLLRCLLSEGSKVAPRKQACREVIDVKFKVFEPRKNLVVTPYRRLAYKFAVAEWLWIWYGLDDVKTIARYNPNVSKFSDDGKVFAGAYGPHIVGQWERTIDKLREDPDTRQAVITILANVFRIPSSKDVPCTVSIQFLRRPVGTLNTIVTMRSSDVWLGLPYDFFTFSMLMNIACAQLRLKIGTLTFNLGSSHLYERDVQRVYDVIYSHVSCLESPTLQEIPPRWLKKILQREVTILPSDRKEPWSTYGRVLLASTNKEALLILENE